MSCSRFRLNLVLPFLLLLLMGSLSNSLTSGHKNGILKLIVKTYLDDLMSVTDPIDEAVIRSRLSRLGDHISNHPALNQKRLFVGHMPPNYDPDRSHNQLQRAFEANYNKRQGPMVDVMMNDDSGSSSENSTSTASETTTATEATTEGTTSTTTPSTASLMKTQITKSDFPSEEICVTDRSWELINETTDFFDNRVEVIQEEGLQQFVFTYKCANEKGSCTGISPFYHSECTERFGWIYMYHRKSPKEQPQWGYLAAPHHCACRIQPLPHTTRAPEAQAVSRKK